MLGFSERILDKLLTLCLGIYIMYEITEKEITLGTIRAWRGQRKEAERVHVYTV